MAEMKTMTINGEQFVLPFAPAGYGLGVLVNYPVSNDTEIDNVLVDVINSLPDTHSFKRIVLSFTTTTNFTGGGGHWYTDIYKLSTNYAMITAKSYINGGKTVQRIWYGGVLQPWEHDNPPMALGVEYRTTERWQGKAVYVKAVDLGALPNATSAYISINVSGITGAVDCIPTFRNTETGDQYTGLITEVDKVYFAGYGTVMIKTNMDARKFTAVAACKYTKD